MISDFSSLAFVHFDYRIFPSNFLYTSKDLNLIKNFIVTLRIDLTSISLSVDCGVFCVTMIFLIFKKYWLTDFN